MNYLVLMEVIASFPNLANPFFNNIFLTSSSFEFVKYPVTVYPNPVMWTSTSFCKNEDSKTDRICLTFDLTVSLSKIKK